MTVKELIQQLTALCEIDPTAADTLIVTYADGGGFNNAVTLNAPAVIVDDGEGGYAAFMLTGWRA